MDFNVQTPLSFTYSSAVGFVVKALAAAAIAADKRTNLIFFIKNKI
jgi:hypothetical protein